MLYNLLAPTEINSHAREREKEEEEEEAEELKACDRTLPLGRLNSPSQFEVEFPYHQIPITLRAHVSQEEEAAAAGE